MSDIVWTFETRTLGELAELMREDNPRYSTAEDQRHLAKTLKRFGQPIPIIIDPVSLLDGHQRIPAWIKEKGAAFPVTVAVSNVVFTREMWEEFVLEFHAGAMGQWDFEELGNWDIGTIVEGGFNKGMLEELNRKQAFLIELLGDGDSEEPPDVDFREYDETTANDVKMCECPECGHRFPA